MKELAPTETTMLLLNDENRMIFLLTSTAFPYIKDALDLLFLPSGVHYRFRYRRELVPDEFFTEDGIKELKGKKAILIHVHTCKEEEDRYRILEFIPLREGKIDNVRNMGEFLWIQFVLGDWIIYHKEPKTGEVNEFHELFKRQIPGEYHDFLKHIMFFVEGFKVKTIQDDPTGEKEDVLQNWTLMVKHVSKIESHQDSIFIKILSIKDINTRKSVPAKLLDTHVSGYELESSKVYIIDFVQYYPRETEIKPFYMNIVTPDVIIPIKGEAEIKGKYDLLNFLINTKSVEKTINTFIEFKALSKEKNVISETFFNIRIKGQRLKVVLLLLLFGLGIMLEEIAIQLAEIMAGKSFNPVAIVAAISGGIFSTLGLFFLRRT